MTKSHMIICDYLAKERQPQFIMVFCSHSEEPETEARLLLKERILAVLADVDTFNDEHQSANVIPFHFEE